MICILLVAGAIFCGSASGVMVSTERSVKPAPQKKAVPIFTPGTLAPPYLDHAYFDGHEFYPFQADAASLNWGNAWWLAEAATLAYADEAFAVECFRKSGLGEVRFFDRRSTQCYVASNATFAVVAFRGSEVWRRRQKADAGVVLSDFMTNADLWLTDWPKGGKVHRGFRKALDEVWEELHAYLAQLKRGGRRIWMTGHSLGAALATLAADLHGEVQGLYTFGSPRVGNARFKECYSVRRAYRFVNGSDIVAQLPPPGFYAHVGEPQFIDREGNIRPRPDEGAGDEETASAENKDVSNGSDWVPGPVLDHVPLRYAIRIWNHLMSME